MRGGYGEYSIEREGAAPPGALLPLAVRDGRVDVPGLGFAVPEPEASRRGCRRTGTDGPAADGREGAAMGATGPDRAPFRTLAGPGEACLEVRRSRFFAHAVPLPEDPERLRAWLEGVRAGHRDARHVVFAWRGRGERSRASDDGEPHGTAARPCHDALAHAGVCDAAVACARVWGGVQLGAGNLGRAYADAARAAIADAGVVTLVPHLEVRVRARYADVAAVEAALRAAAATDLARSAASSGLEVTGWLPAGHAAALVRELARVTAGRAGISLGETPRDRPSGTPGRPGAPGTATPGAFRVPSPAGSRRGPRAPNA